MADLNPSLPIPKPSNANNAGNFTKPPEGADLAVNVIRQKVSRLYADEPEIIAEEQGIEATGAHSSHQEFIKQLLNSGKGLAEIQTAWHDYYQALPDSEKHAVWQEFYKIQAQTIHNHKKTTPNKNTGNTTRSTQKLNQIHGGKSRFREALYSQMPDTPEPQKVSTVNTKKDLLDKVNKRAKLKPRAHLQSIMFGLSMGFIVVSILMFGLFNERFIAPFITPSRTASTSPIIIDPNATVGPESLIIIPKINVEVPVVYDIPSIAESDIQNGLENGVVHYPNTPSPGQDGNMVIVGHSSNNLLNTGKYKFAFVLLNKMQLGDTITLQHGGKRYVYKVYERKVVNPNDVGVLGQTDKKASLTLITCDPPGTSLHRLVIWAEQISPSPDGNQAATSLATTQQIPEVVPGNAPSLFDRLFGWL